MNKKFDQFYEVMNFQQYCVCATEYFGYRWIKWTFHAVKVTDRINTDTQKWRRFGVHNNTEKDTNCDSKKKLSHFHANIFYSQCSHPCQYQKEYIQTVSKIKIGSLILLQNATHACKCAMLFCSPFRVLLSSAAQQKKQRKTPRLCDRWTQVVRTTLNATRQFLTAAKKG